MVTDSRRQMLQCDLHQHEIWTESAYYTCFLNHIAVPSRHLHKPVTSKHAPEPSPHSSNWPHSLPPLTSRSFHQVSFLSQTSSSNPCFCLFCSSMMMEFHSCVYSSRCPKIPHRFPGGLPTKYTLPTSFSSRCSFFNKCSSWRQLLEQSHNWYVSSNASGYHSIWIFYSLGLSSNKIFYFSVLDLD